MQKEKIKIAVSWLLTVICMGVIFWLSSRTADESSAQSSAIVEFLTGIFGDNVFTDFIVRKLAHCLEFTGLCLLINISLYLSRNKKSPILSVALTSIYAVTDEIHQLFVQGRSCELRDWFIDTVGAILGAIAFTVILKIFKIIVQKKKNNIDIGNI